MSEGTNLHLKCPLVREYLHGASASHHLSNPHRARGERPHGAEHPPTIPSETHQGITVSVPTHTNTLQHLSLM